MDGHVFVIHGSLTDLHADAVLVPCDITGDVSRHWGRFCLDTDGARQLSAQVRNGWVSSKRTTADGQVCRYVDTGATRASAARDLLAERVAAGLSALADDVARARGSLTGRPRPLLALPMVGTGAGGFDVMRGEALSAILQQARSVAVTSGVDIVIVCWHRSDYVAVQRQRAESHWDWADAAHLPAAADELAEQLRRQRLVLFFGAGVSRAAGLNDFEGLVSALERGYGMCPPPGQDLPTRVQRLKARSSSGELKSRVLKQLDRSRYSMAHGLLASLRVREAITTNFDQLYELAARRPYASEFDESSLELDIHPWQRTSAARPWLLKAHGDADRPGDLVFSADEYVGFRDNHRPVASVLQAMFALSREVLFVGYSLRDENVTDLMEEAVAYHRLRGADQVRLGTVLDLEGAGTNTQDERVTVGLRVGGEPVEHAARRLELFLDCVGWSACRNEASWLLDTRYEALLESKDRDVARSLRDVALPASELWQPVRQRLREFGRHI